MASQTPTEAPDVGALFRPRQRVWPVEDRSTPEPEWLIACLLFGWCGTPVEPPALFPPPDDGDDDDDFAPGSGCEGGGYGNMETPGERVCGSDKVKCPPDTPCCRVSTIDSNDELCRWNCEGPCEEQGGDEGGTGSGERIVILF